MRERDFPSLGFQKTHFEVLKRIGAPPSPEIPIERGRTHLFLQPVARHEAKHAIAAIETGQGVEEFSVERSGNVLGYVRPVKRDNPAAFQTIAMASSVDDHPEGTGSDLKQTEILQYAPGGVSKQTAFQTAASIIFRYSKKFWDKLSDIGAFVKKGNENQFKQWMRRAKWELERDEIIKKFQQFPPSGVIFEAKSIG